MTRSHFLKIINKELFLFLKNACPGSQRRDTWRGMSPREIRGLGNVLFLLFNYNDFLLRLIHCTSPLVRMLWPLVGMWWPLVGTRTDSRGCLRISGDARALASDHLRPRQKSARIARDSQTATAVCACSHQRPPHSDQRPQHSDQRPAIA